MMQPRRVIGRCSVACAMNGVVVVRPALAQGYGLVGLVGWVGLGLGLTWFRVR